MGLYEKIDKEIMNVVNAGVHAWNWTTGRTKGDLASLLEVSGNTLAGVMPLMILNPVIGASNLIITSGLSIINLTVNKQIDKKEEVALKKYCRDAYVEMCKSGFKASGPIAVGAGGCILARGISRFSGNEETAICSVGIGAVLQGTGMYVSRADYLPPRKNVLSRAKDKVVEMYKNLKPKAARIQAPSFSYSSGKSLEEQLAKIN